MALTANNSRAKIDFGQLVDEITDDPKVAPNEILRPEKNNKEENLSLQKKEEPKTKTSDTITENREESSLSKQFEAQPKKTRGYQKSIYLAADVYDYVTSIAEKYNIRISQVINTIIRDVKKHEE